MTSDQDLENLYEDYLGFTGDKVNEYGALQVAAIMMTQALSIYKTSLNEQDFHRMVDSISENRDKIKKFEGPVLQ